MGCLALIGLLMLAGIGSALMILGLPLIGGAMLLGGATSTAAGKGFGKGAATGCLALFVLGIIFLLAFGSH